jgi:hypothetical protein
MALGAVHTTSLTTSTVLLARACLLRHVLVRVCVCVCVCVCVRVCVCVCV